MPKLRIRAKGASRSSAQSIQRKFRIGTRKAGVSGNKMTTEDLQKALVDPDKSRYITKIKAVLNMRGIAA